MNFFDAKINDDMAKENKAYQDIWLSAEKCSGKTIHVIPMYHKSDDVDVNRQRIAIESQKIVYRVLCSLKPSIIGIEGFYGERFSIDSYTAQIKEQNKLHGGSKYSSKSYRAKLLKEINQYQWAPFKYVIEKKVWGLGIEHPHLHNISVAILDKKGLSQKAKLELVTNFAAPRTIHALARCVEALSKYGDTTLLALPMGARHYDEIQVLSHMWELNFVYHTEAINVS